MFECAQCIGWWIGVLGEAGLPLGEASRWWHIPPQLDCPAQRVARGAADIWWPAGPPEGESALVTGRAGGARAVLALRERNGELLGVQFEMLALAWQTNRTKVATMKMVEEASMRTYPNLGVHEAFHPTSHWGGFPERVANLRLIQNYHTSVFAKFVQRLRDMREGDGSVLDHSIILFGSNMANSDAHNNDPLPQALIGRGGGIKGNQHLHYKQDTPHANILVTMLDRAGVPTGEIEKFADTTGALSEA